MSGSKGVGEYEVGSSRNCVGEELLYYVSRPPDNYGAAPWLASKRRT